MKLLTKTTLYFFATMVFLLVIVGIYLFRQFSSQINERSDRELLAEEQGWIDYLQTGLENGRAFILKTREVSIFPVDALPEEFPVLENITDGQKNSVGLPYRQLSQVVPIGNISYQVVIKKITGAKSSACRKFYAHDVICTGGTFCFYAGI